jgi:hypothetical protein
MSLHGTSKDRPDCGGHDVFRIEDEDCDSDTQLNNNGSQSAKWQECHSLCQLLSKGMYLRIFDGRTCPYTCGMRSCRFDQGSSSNRCLVSRSEADANYARFRN